MTTAKEWLDLYAKSPREFAVEGAKILKAKPYKHRLSPIPGMMWKCRRCGIEIQGNEHARQPSQAGECHPDPLALDWNTAMEAYRNCGQFVVAIATLEEIASIQVGCFRDTPWAKRQGAFIDWLTLFAQPHHYITAAILATLAGQKGETK